MSEKNEMKDSFFEEIVKKTKTGSVTIPKDLREELLGPDEEDTYFHLIVPKEKDKIVLEFISEEDAARLDEKIKDKPKTTKSTSSRTTKKTKKKKSTSGPEPKWNEYFVYDFGAREKVQPILASAYEKFKEEPINFEDAMGRIKYALVSFLSSTKTENSKLYFSIIKFLVDIVDTFDQPNLIDWMFDKIVPSIDSKFLYELALLELIDVSIRKNRWEKAELFIFYVLKNIDSYTTGEMYNIMNSFKQLVKAVKDKQRTQKIDTLLKEKLMEYGEGVEDIDYKIQIVEFLEDLNYIEIGYKLAKKIQLSLPPESMRLEQVRKLVKRLHETPITENKV